MTDMYVWIYVEVNAICAILLMMILCRDRQERRSERLAFNRVVLATLLILLLDIAWIVLEGRADPAVRALNALINSCYLSFSGLIGYLWFQYSDCKMKRAALRGWRRALLLAPMVFLLALCAASPWTGWMYTVSASGVYERGLLHYWQQVITFGYLALATVRSLYFMRGESNRDRRREMLTLLGFILLPILGGVLGILYFGLPSVWPAVALSLLMVYITFQDDQISTDPLTGLNNRRQFDKFLAAALTDARRTERMQLILLDVDSFKRINDTYGHLEGDRALTETAAVLKRVCARRDAFLARYGGDEFAIISHCETEESLGQLAEDIREGFRQRNRRPEARFPLSASIGVAEFDPSHTNSASRLIQTADEALYREKARLIAARR